MSNNIVDLTARRVGPDTQDGPMRHLGVIRDQSATLLRAALQQALAPRPLRLPFLFLLNEDDAAGRMRAAQLGTGEFLIKPVYLKEALSRVALLLEKQAQRGERAHRFQRWASDLLDLQRDHRAVPREVRRGEASLQQSRPERIHRLVAARERLLGKRHKLLQLIRSAAPGNLLIRGQLAAYRTRRGGCFTGAAAAIFARAAADTPKEGIEIKARHLGRAAAGADLDTFGNRDVTAQAVGRH